MTSTALKRNYSDSIRLLLDSLFRDEEESINRAAGILAHQIAEDRLIHVFGVSGHSVIGCEEFFWRAGGLASINPLFDASLLLAGGGRKSTMLERVPGIGDKVVAAQNPKPGEVLIITSIYGMNAATIDAALEAKRLGLLLIAITSLDHASKTPLEFAARHPNGCNLSEIADITIDNHVPHGDVLLSLDGLEQKIGASSTILVSACVQWLVGETARQCLELGVKPPVWQSANVPGGDERNSEYLSRFLPRIKTL